MTSIPVFFLLAATLTAPGDWPEPRHNPSLTSIQPMHGAMAQAPTALGKIDLGQSVPSLTPATLKDGVSVGLSIVSGTLRCFNTNGSLRWESHPAGLNYESIIAHEDLDGDGESEVLLQAGRPTQPFGAACLVTLEDGQLLWRYDVEPMSYAWYLHYGAFWPGDTKKQIVVLMHAYPPDKDNGYIALFAFEGQRAPVRKWRYAFDEYTCFPSFLQSDIDGDNIKELVVETHSRMWHFDAITGEKKHHIHWKVTPANERSYGLVKFTDLDKDGREDFLCIATFAQHHEVLLNKAGKLEKVWHHGWDESVTTGKVATTYPDEPDVDVDGDGSLEVLVSMYGAEKDTHWVLRIYDAVTGAIKYRVPGLIAVGTADLDGDGSFEVLANASTDPAKAKTDGVRLLSFKDGPPTVLWEDTAYRAAASSKRGDLRVEHGAEILKVLIDPSDTVTLEPWSKPPKENRPTFSNVPAIVGPGIPELLAADITGDGRNDLLLYQPPDARVFSWNGSGFDQAGAFTSSTLPVIADLDGDGKLEVVTCAVTPAQTPIVEATTPALENRPLWRTQLPAAARAGLPHARLAYLRTAHFLGNTTPDLYLYAGTPIVRSAALNGRTGEMIWDKGETPGLERYWAPTVNLASTLDFDADGKGDLVFTNPDYYCVASAVNGESLLGPLFPPTIFNQPSQGLYTLPAILNRAENGPLVALVGGHYFQGAMTLRAEPLWHALPVCGEARSGMEGFLQNTDGAWLMGFGRQNGSFACVNVNDGAVRWELPVDASCTDVVACDIDGDGKQEFVFGTSHANLYAVGDDNGRPRTLWQAKLNAAAGAPILADITGDGKTDIAVPTADGYVSLFASPASN
ncbi:MAG: VCBS repeat-containing protein [Candidatus Hydrogenedentes bacterium]|nr:VCBS repeat-containing protein [Candidatus Hydrogenedentota bacterium]